MVGKPIHVKYALEAGVDLICCQGGEGGGHTGAFLSVPSVLSRSILLILAIDFIHLGNVPTSILVPACVDACKGKKSPLTGEPVSRFVSRSLFLPS